MMTRLPLRKSLLTESACTRTRLYCKGVNTQFYCCVFNRMSVWNDSLAALSGVGSWPSLYFLASYLHTTETAKGHHWVLYALQAILSEVQLQRDSILADLENWNDEYRQEVSLLLEQGKPFQMTLHIPRIVMSTILCLEASLVSAKDHLNPTNQEVSYTAISKSLSLAAISFGYIHSQLLDEDNEVVSNESELTDVIIWITNFMLYLSESLLKLSYYNSDSTEGCVDPASSQPKIASQIIIPDYKEDEYRFRSKEPSVTQFSDVSFPDILSRCKELYIVVESIRNLILTRLRDIQLDPPLALQLMSYFFWMPGQSFEDGMQSAKVIYKRLQGLTAVSLSNASTSDGVFISPEHMQQERGHSNHAKYYNSDQIVAAQLVCLKVLQLLEIAPILSARPNSIKRLQRLFLSSFRILEAQEHSEEAETILNQGQPSSILAEIAGVHKGNPLQFVTYLRLSFYRAILNYYCNTPQSDLYDIILCNLDSISINNVTKIETADMHNILSSINEYVSVLLTTVDTCIKNICINNHENNCSVWHTGLDIKFIGYIDSLYGLLTCLPSRLDPFEDLIVLTNSTISLLYYYEEAKLQNTRHLAMLTPNFLFKMAIQKLKALFRELLKLYALILNLEYPASQLETNCFQEHISRLLARRMHKQLRSDPRFIAKQTIQQAKTLISNHCSDDKPKFSFAALAKKISFMIFKNANDASLQENLQCILFYLMMKTPTCLFDYIVTSRTMQKLHTDFASTNDINVLMSTSKGLFAHINLEIVANRFNIIDADMQSRLHATYSELLSAIVVCSEIFA